MSQVTFFLSLPRSRTAWLATYLTGMGVYCFHELWRDVTNIKDFKAAIESKGPGPVANVDACNWFFLDDLHEAFPDAQFIKIERMYAEVWASMVDNYGGDLLPLSNAYEAVKHSEISTPVSVYHFEEWTPTTSKFIWSDCCGDEIRGFNEDWHRRMHQLNVQITADRIADDLAMRDAGALPHLRERIARYARRGSWVQ